MSSTASAQLASDRQQAGAGSVLHGATARYRALQEEDFNDYVGALGGAAAERIQRIEQAAILEERSRLARDLHDSATQTLVSLTMIAEGCRSLAAEGKLPDADRHFARIGVIAADALRELRALIHQLYPPVLATLGFSGALQQRLTTLEERFGVTTRLSGTTTISLAPHIEEQLYWITLEALNNAVKHARAGTVLVQLAQHDNGALHVIVCDDGCGFRAEQPQPGCGLRTMRERAELIGATLAITSAPGAGTVVTVVGGGSEGAQCNR